MLQRAVKAMEEEKIREETSLKNQLTQLKEQLERIEKEKQEAEKREKEMERRNDELRESEGALRRFFILFCFFFLFFFNHSILIEKIWNFEANMTLFTEQMRKKTEVFFSFYLFIFFCKKTKTKKHNFFSKPHSFSPFPQVKEQCYY